MWSSGEVESCDGGGRVLESGVVKFCVFDSCRTGGFRDIWCRKQLSMDFILKQELAKVLI